MSSAPNRRSILLMAWVHARQGQAKFGGSPRLYLAAALRQAWAEEKAEIARKAARLACLDAQAALDVRLADMELSRLAARNTTYITARGYARGRIAGGRW